MSPVFQEKYSKKSSNILNSADKSGYEQLYDHMKNLLKDPTETNNNDTCIYYYSSPINKRK